MNLKTTWAHYTNILLTIQNVINFRDFLLVTLQHDKSRKTKKIHSALFQLPEEISVTLKCSFEKQPLFKAVLCVTTIDLTKKDDTSTNRCFYTSHDYYITSHTVGFASVSGVRKFPGFWFCMTLQFFWLSGDTIIFLMMHLNKREVGSFFLGILSIVATSTSPPPYFPYVVSSLFQGTCTQHQCQYMSCFHLLSFVSPITLCAWYKLSFSNTTSFPSSQREREFRIIKAHSNWTVGHNMRFWWAMNFAKYHFSPLPYSFQV